MTNTSNTRKITIIDRDWAYAIETPDYYDAEAVTEADAQQDGQVRTLRADDLLEAIAKAAHSADTDREPLGLQTSSQLAWNVIRQWVEGDGPHPVQDGTYYVTTMDGTHWRIVVAQGRATVEDTRPQYEVVDE